MRLALQKLHANPLHPHIHLLLLWPDVNLNSRLANTPMFRSIPSVNLNQVWNWPLSSRLADVFQTRYKPWYWVSGLLIPNLYTNPIHFWAKPITWVKIYFKSWLRDLVISKPRVISRHQSPQLQTHPPSQCHHHLRVSQNHTSPLLLTPPSWKMENLPLLPWSGKDSCGVSHLLWGLSSSMGYSLIPL